MFTSICLAQYQSKLGYISTLLPCFLTFSVRATNTNRTIESLQGVLGGLFGMEAFSGALQLTFKTTPFHSHVN